MSNFKFDLQTFAEGVTKTGQMIIPEVMADMISVNLPKLIRFTNIATIDTTLEGRPGNELTIPSWNYIGPAVDVAEYEAIPITQMSAGTKKFTIKKAGKAIEISDEALLSGYGDPLGEGSGQLALSIADKIDDDIVEALSGAKISYSAATLTYEAIVDAVDKFEEETDYDKVLYLHPNEITMLRKDPNFIDKSKYGNDVMARGEIGMVAGCRIVKSRRVPKDGTKFTNYLISLSPTSDEGQPAIPAISILLKRQAAVESDRDILKKSTVVSADVHYGVALTNESKVIKFEVGA